MIRSMRSCAAGVAMWALFSAVAAGGEPAEGLRVDFDDGTRGGISVPAFVSAETGTDADGVSWRVEDGVLTVGSDFASDNLKSASDYVTMVLADTGGVSVLEYPVFEIRLRMANAVGDVCVLTTYEYADGSRQQPYFYVDFGGVQKEWVTVANRLVGDSSAPSLWTPRKLVHLVIRVRGEGPLELAIDRIRLRGLNDSERARENEWIALVADREPVESERVKTFFPFGVYDAEPDSSSTHKMSHRMTFRMLAKNHLNFVKASSTNVTAAEEMGVSIGVRMRAAGYWFEQGGTQAVIDWAKPIVDLVKHSPAVICYDVGDERPISALWGIAAANRILADLDPTRNAVLTFWDAAAIRAYGPYVAVDVADIYPLVDGRDTGAAYLYDWCRQVARANGNKRQWIILQSFGSAPWRPRAGYLVPTVAQLRLQIWAALAGGARGIIMYSTSYDRYRMLTDQWGNPNELMQEAARLGEILIPLGRRLLDCTVDFDTGITCDNDKILVGVVRARERGACYVILANGDEETAQGGRLAGFDGGLHDMTALREVDGGTIEPLRPGGGCMYMVGTADMFKAEAEIVRRNRDEEEKRAATPDRLFAARRCDPGQRDQLDEVARRMGKIEPVMYWDYPDDKIVALMTPFRDRYWGIHARWVRAYEALLQGEPLPADNLAAIVRHSGSLVQEVTAIPAARQKLLP